MADVKTARPGFSHKTIQAEVADRKNGKWIQLVITDKDGKERFFIMQEVPSLRAPYKREESPF